MEKDDHNSSNIWHKIDTAPKDGTIMLGCDSDSIFIFNFCMGDWHEYSVYGEIAYEIEPILWMPLPKLPQCKADLHKADK